MPLGKRSILFVLVRDGIWAYAIIFGKSRESQVVLCYV